MKDFQLECIEKNAPLELRELWEPLRTFKDLLRFVSAPRGWTRRGCNQVCGKDGVLRVSFEEFVDEKGSWSLQLNHNENRALLRPLRLHLMPVLEDSVLSLGEEELKQLAAAAVTAHLNASEESASSFTAFRKATGHRYR